MSARSHHLSESVFPLTLLVIVTTAQPVMTCVFVHVPRWLRYSQSYCNEWMLKSNVWDVQRCFWRRFQSRSVSAGRGSVLCSLWLPYCYTVTYSCVIGWRVNFEQGQARPGEADGCHSFWVRLRPRGRSSAQPAQRVDLAWLSVSVTGRPL